MKIATPGQQFKSGVTTKNLDSGRGPQSRMTKTTAASVNAGKIDYSSAIGAPAKSEMLPPNRSKMYNTGF